MEKRIVFFGINLDILSFEETLDKISNYIEERKCIQHVVVNVAKLVYAQKDTQLKEIINECPLINVDGAGIILGAKFLGIDIPERVAGIDLMEKLVQRAAEKQYRVYFFGAEEEIVQKVKDVYLEQHPNLIIAGCRNGYYTENEEEQIVEQIKQANADILFVAMGSPKKEIFLNKYSNYLQIPFTMGVGGSFDVVAGKVKRAPLFMQKLKSEWIFRLIQEPRRMWKRYFTTNSIFAMMLLKEYFRQKCSGK